MKVVDQEKTINTARGTTIPSVATFYQITAQGIEKIEGPSRFQPPDRYPGINVQATGANVITLGDGNYVNVNHQHMFTKLSELEEALTESPALPDNEKLEVAVDIETLEGPARKARA